MPRKSKTKEGIRSIVQSPLGNLRKENLICFVWKHVIIGIGLSIIIACTQIGFLC